MTKFFDLFKQFKASVDDIHEYIDAWHENPKDTSVCEYLGLTVSEYAIFIRYPERAEALRGEVTSNLRDGFLLSNFDAMTTGIPGTIIWVASGESGLDLSRGEHGPRFEVTVGGKLTNEALSRSIIVKLLDPPVVVGEVPPDLKNQIVTFALNNRQIFLDYWNSKISTREMASRIRPLVGE